MSLEPAQLVRRCVEIVRSFDPATETVDVHAAAFLDARKIAQAERRAKAEKAAAGAAATAAITGAAAGGGAADTAPPFSPRSQSRNSPPPSPPPSPLERLAASGASTRGAAAAALAVAARDSDDLFVQQVFYGVQRQARALRVFLNALFHLNAATLVRQDYTLFQVLSYLVLFRLPEMGMRKLGVLLDSQEPAKMHTLLSFAFNKPLLAEWVVEGWCKFLDRPFVEELLAALDQLRPDATAWLDSRYTKAFGHSMLDGGGSHASGGSGGSGSPPPPPGVTHVPRKASTVPVAPNITKPKPRFAPEPLRIPQYISAAPVPEWIEATSLAEIEERNAALKRANAEKVRAKYDFERTVPKLHETKNTADALRAEVEAQRERDAQPVHKARPPPPLPARGADVKLNAAAILREDAALTAKHAKEAAVIRAFEGNLRDTTEYFAWQEEMRRQDEQAKLDAVEMRKREAAEASRAAQAAEAVLAAQSRAIVRDMRAAGEVVMKHLALDRAEEVKTRRAVAEQVKRVEYVAPALAKVEVQAAKRVNHDRLREKSLTAEAMLEKQREREQAERAELLRRIRALERVPRVQVKTFDPNSLSGVGLLSEMSLVELHDRLALLQRSRQAEEEERRRGILRGKREQEELMLARVDNIRRVRAQQSEMSRERRAEDKARERSEAERAAEERDEKLLALSAQLQARRERRAAELRAIEEEEAAREKAAQFLGGQRAETEAARLASRLLGSELRAQREQELLLDERAVEVAVQEAEKRAAALRAVEDAEKGKAAEKAKKLALALASREEQAFRLADAARRKHMFFEAADREMALLSMRDSLNEYAAARRHGDQDAARAARGGPPRDEQKQETLRRRMERLPEGHPLALTLSMRVTQGAVARAERQRLQAARAAEEEQLGVAGLPQ